jgi:predicted ATPase
LTTQSLLEELIATADEKGAPYLKSAGIMYRGWVLALNGRTLEAVHAIASGIKASRGTGATLWTPMFLSVQAHCHAALGQFDEASSCLSEAMAQIAGTQETWLEAEVHRIAGQVALMPQLPDTVKALAYFEHALAVARQQHARSWELRTAISLASLWRSEGKPQQARELLAPVYGWFTEGFDTLDLKEAKALLDEL